MDLVPTNISIVPITPHKAAPMIYCVPSSFQIRPITSTITSGAELPTAEQILLKTSTVSLSPRLGVITFATLFIESPKFVTTAHKTAIVVT